MMKTTKLKMFYRYGIALMSFFMVTSVAFADNKPKLNVQFSFDTNSSITGFIEGDVQALEDQLEAIIIRDLSETIGFLEFSNEANLNTLTITLKDVAGTSIMGNNELWLYFDLSTDSTNFEHKRKFINEGETMTINEDNIISLFEQKWKLYMTNGLELELMPKLFSKIAFTITESKHYNLEDNPKSVVLPFSSNYLRIECEQSEFRVETIVISDENNELRVPEDVTKGSAQNDSILIPLFKVTTTSIKIGKIYIITYKSIASDDEF